MSLFLLLCFFVSSATAFTTTTLSNGVVVGCFTQGGAGCGFTEQFYGRLSQQNCEIQVCNGASNCLFWWNSQGCEGLVCSQLSNPANNQQNCNADGTSPSSSFFVVPPPTTSTTTTSTTSTTTTTTPITTTTHTTPTTTTTTTTTPHGTEVLGNGVRVACFSDVSHCSEAGIIHVSSIEDCENTICNGAGGCSFEYDTTPYFNECRFISCSPVLDETTSNCASGNAVGFMVYQPLTTSTTSTTTPTTTTTTSTSTTTTPVPTTSTTTTTTTTTPAAVTPYVTCTETDSGSTNLASTTVTNPNACWNFCQTTTSCFGATIYGGTCFAKTSQLLNAISAAPPTTLLLPAGFTCPVPYISCSGVDLNAATTVFQTTSDPSTCWYFCQNTPGCVAATFTIGYCYARFASDLTVPVKASSFQTLRLFLPLGYLCPAVGAIPALQFTTCPGRDVAGDIVGSSVQASINTFAACWGFCQSTPGCVVAVLSTGTCYAKSSLALNNNMGTNAAGTSFGTTLLMPPRFSCPAIGSPAAPVSTSGFTGSLQCAPISGGIFLDSWTGTCTFLFGYEFPTSGSVTAFSIGVQQVTGTPVYLGVFSFPGTADPINTNYTVVGGTLYTPTARGNFNVTLSTPIAVSAGHVLGHCTQNGQPGQIGWLFTTGSSVPPNAAQISLTTGPIPMTAFSVGQSFNTVSGQYSQNGPVTVSRFYLMSAYYTTSSGPTGIGYQACQSYVSCPNTAAAVFGFDLGSQGNIAGEAACWALCQATPGCAFADWYPTGSQCFPKSYAGLFSPNVQSNSYNLLPTQYNCVGVGSSIATPPPHAVVTQATYLACYFDNSGTPLLPSSSTSANGGFTATTCQALALANNARYFGLENGGTCLYGNTLSSTSVSTHCFIPCTADQSHSCGGVDSADIYQATALPTPSQFRLTVGFSLIQGLGTYVIPITPGITSYSINSCRDPSMVSIQDSQQLLTEYNTSTLLLGFPVETITQSGVGTIGVAGYSPTGSETHVVGTICVTTACAAGVNVARTRGQVISFSAFNSQSATAPPLVYTVYVPDGASGLTQYTITVNSGVCSTPAMFEFQQSQTYSNTNEGGQCNGAAFETTLSNRFVSAPLSQCSAVSVYPIDACVQMIVPDILPGSSPPCSITSAGYTIAETFSVFTPGTQPVYITETWTNSAGVSINSGSGSSILSSSSATHRFGVPPTAQLQIGQTYYLFWDTSVFALGGTGARIQNGHKYTVAVSVIAASTSGVTPIPVSLKLSSGGYYSFSKDCNSTASGLSASVAYFPTPEGAFINAVITGSSSSSNFKLSILNQTTVGGYDIINALVFFPLTNQLLTWIVQGSPIGIPMTPTGFAPSAAQITTFFSPANGFSASIWKMSIYQPIPANLDPTSYAQGITNSPETNVVYSSPADPSADAPGCHDFQFRSAYPTAPTASAEGSITFSGVSVAPGSITTASATGVLSGGSMNLCRPAPLATETIQFSAVFGNTPTFGYLGYSIVVAQGGSQIGSRSVSFSTPKMDTATVADIAIVYSYASSTPLVVTWTFLGPFSIPFVYTYQVSIGACAGLQGFYMSRVLGGFPQVNFIAQPTGTNTYSIDVYSLPVIPNGVYLQLAASFIPGLPTASVVTEVNYRGDVWSLAQCFSCSQQFFSDMALFGNDGLFGGGWQITTAYPASLTPIVLNAWTLTVGVGPTAIVYTMNVNLHFLNLTQLPNNIKPLAMNTGAFVSGTYGLGTNCLDFPSTGYASSFSPLLNGDGRLLWSMYNNYTSQGFQVQTIGTARNVTVSGTVYYTINATITHVVSGLVLTWIPTNKSETIGQYWSWISQFLPLISGNPINQTTLFWSANPSSGQWYATPANQAFDPTNTANLQNVGYANEIIYPNGGLACWLEFLAYTVNPVQIPQGAQVGRPSYFQAILWNQGNTKAGQAKSTPVAAVSAGQTSFQLNLCSLSVAQLASIQLQATFPSAALLPYTVAESIQQSGNPTLLRQSTISTVPASGTNTISGSFINWYSLQLFCGANDLTITWIIEEAISGGGFQQETFTINIHVGPCRAPDYFFAQGTDNTGTAFPAFVSVPSTGLLSPASSCQPLAQSSGSTTISVAINNCIDASTGRTSNPFNSNLTVQIVAAFTSGTNRWPTAVVETVSPILTPNAFGPLIHPVPSPSASVISTSMTGTSYTYSQLGLSSGTQTGFVQFLWDASVDLGFKYQISVNNLGYCQVPTTTTTTTTTTVLGQTTGPSTTSTTSTTTTVAPTGPVTHTVVVSDFALTPKNLIVSPGDSVTWALAPGSSTHGVLSTTTTGGCSFSQSNAALVNSPLLTASGYTNTFIVEGVYPYSSPFDCSSFPAMRGTITVQAQALAPTTTASPTTTAAPTQAATTTGATTASSLSTGAISGIAAAAGVVCLGVVGAVVLYATGVIGSAGSGAGVAGVAAIAAVAGEDVGLFSASADERRLF